MKILILANHDVGLYQFRKELIQKLLEENNTVDISLPNGEMVAELEKMGCTFFQTQVDRRGLNPVKDVKLFFAYKKLLKKNRPELVITYTIKPNIYGGLACGMAKIPYAVNITGLGTAFQKKGWLRRLVVFLYKLGLKRARVVFFENIENRKIFVNEGIIKENVACLLNGAGVNLERYSYCQYPTDNDVIRFLFVGRIMKEKGVDELFCAMKRLISEGYSCLLDVVGGYEEDYADRISEYEKEGWLRYHGYQKDVRPFIEKAHCFVLPSYHEGMANTNLECAAMGRPLITSNIHGCKEAIVEGKSGYLCEPKDEDSLYRCMMEFLHLSDEQKNEMGKCGRQHMQERFDKGKVVAQTVERLY